jgi:hypothetical protein
MTLLTPAECREIAERKMVEAEGDPVHGREFRATAHAWLVLAEMIESMPGEPPTWAFPPDRSPARDQWLP